MKAAVLWIERLRWGLALAHVALIGSVALEYAPHWPLAPLVGLLVAGIASNVLVTWRRRTSSVSGRELGALLIFDTALLTVLLAITGGSSSPFSLMYLVPVISASFALSPAGAWTVMGATGVAYLSLFVFGPAPAHHHDATEMRAHITGMFLAYACAAPLIVVALTRVGALRIQAEERVVEALHIQARTRHLASLATLAAGAAHELATPLSTIMMVAREMERKASVDADREDLALIREEVLVCQEILAQLSADAGAGMGEIEDVVDLADLVHEALSGGRYDPVNVTVEGAETTVALPARLIRQMLRRLVGNARDASSGDQPVAVHVLVSTDAVRLQVTDTGVGMTAEVAEHCTEPFFTTKPEGEGTGLGLFFVQSVAQHYGGELRLQTTPGEGTTATISMPTAGESA